MAKKDRYKREESLIKLAYFYKLYIGFWMTYFFLSVSLFFFWFVLTLVQNFGRFSFERFRFNSDSLVDELIVMACHKVFEQNLVSKGRLVRLKVSKFGHNVANGPRKNLPIVLPLLCILL